MTDHRSYHHSSRGRAADVEPSPGIGREFLRWLTEPHRYATPWVIRRRWLAVLLVLLGRATPLGVGIWRIFVPQWAIRFLTWRGWIFRRFDHFDHAHWSGPWTADDELDAREA